MSDREGGLSDGEGGASDGVGGRGDDCRGSSGEGGLDPPTNRSHIRTRVLAQLVPRPLRCCVKRDRFSPHFWSTHTTSTGKMHRSY